jgi:hypothetical protein
MQATDLGHERKKVVGSKSISRFQRLRIIFIVSSNRFSLYFSFLYASVGHFYFVLTLTWSFFFIFFNLGMPPNIWISMAFLIFHSLSSVLIFKS